MNKEDMSEDQKRMQKIQAKLDFPIETPNKNGRIYSEEAVQSLVRKLRKLNEQQEEAAVSKNRKTVYDQQREEGNFRNFFDDLNVDIDFIELEVYDDLIFWGGTIDGIVQFVYKVTPEERTSGIEFNYLDDFSLENPDNDEIVKKIETYYDTFYKYWRNNVLNT